jgi:hypothetical protein
MNLVSLFQFRFVKGQFKDDWVSTKSNDLSDLFFLIHPDVGEIPAVFSHGSSLVFLDMLESPFL